MLTYIEHPHEYAWNGKPVMSVTQIIKAAGLSSFDHAPLNRLAMEYGKLVHLACELDDGGTLDETTVDPQIYPCLQAWRKFKADMKYQSIMAESRVYSAKYGYAGTLDRGGEMGGLTCIVDLKTGGKVREHRIQLAAYEQAAKEYSGFKAEKLLTVRLTPDGYAVDDYTADRKQNFAVFQAALQIARWKNNN